MVTRYDPTGKWDWPIDEAQSGDFVLYDDYAALLADHARLQAVAEELKRFRSLARWVSNSAGHGINANQRRMGEELLVLIDGLEV